MKRRYNPKHADRGATLIIVLIVVSVIGMVTGVILSQADTNVRSTVQLRDQAADNYGADGAMQTVLDSLKTSGIDCSDPGHPYGVVLGDAATPFYSPVSSEQGPLNAYARCTSDPTTGASPTTSVSTPPPTTTVTTVTPPRVTSTGPSLGGGDPTLPTYALLTTGTATGDFGVDISPSAGQKTVCIENGSVASNKDVDASGSGQVLAVRLAPSVSGQGTSDCATGTGVDPGTGSKLLVSAAGECRTLGQNHFRPTDCVPHAAPVAVPGDPALAAGTVPLNPAPTCDSSKTYAAFVPGVYTDVNLLNKPCSNGAARVEWLSPGWYFFNYGTTQWTWPKQLVAGTPVDNNGQPITGLSPTTASTLTKLSTLHSSPGACVDPANVGNADGVAMVFGGASVVGANSGGVAETCATSSASSPPLAIYGLSSSQTVSTTSGPVTIPAETMCSASGCGTSSIIVTAQDGQAEVYIKGYVFAANGQIILTLKNSPGQVFNWGLVVRNLRLTINGSSPTQSVIHLPRPNTGVGTVVTTSTPPPFPSTTVSQPAPVTSTGTYYTIRYVDVWTCTVRSLQQSGGSECPHDGQPNVQVRILTDADGVPQKVLSWNNIR